MAQGGRIAFCGMHIQPSGRLGYYSTELTVLNYGDKSLHVTVEVDKHRQSRQSIIISEGKLNDKSFEVKPGQLHLLDGFVISDDACPKEWGPVTVKNYVANREHVLRCEKANNLYIDGQHEEKYLSELFGTRDIPTVYGWATVQRTDKIKKTFLRMLPEHKKEEREGFVWIRDENKEECPILEAIHNGRKVRAIHGWRAGDHPHAPFSYAMMDNDVHGFIQTEYLRF